jgi:hypothetical protein
MKVNVCVGIVSDTEHAFNLNRQCYIHTQHKICELLIHYYFPSSNLIKH